MASFNLLRLLIKYWLLIIIVTALVMGAAILTTVHKAPSSYGSLSITVQSTRIYPSTPQLILQPDNGGDSQSLAATTQGWLADPSVISGVIQEAGVVVKDNSLKGLSKIFKVVVPVGGSLTYQVEYTGANNDEVQKVYTVLEKALDTLKDQYNSRQNTGLHMSLAYSNPVITSQDSSVPLLPLAGLLTGLVLSLVLVALIEWQTIPKVA